MTHGQRLAAEAAAAAEVRSYQTDPDVVALRVEQIRSQVQRFMWVGMVLGLAFTMVNVQQFAAAGAVVGSLAWCAAWLLDPMVSLILLGVLRAEQVTARWQVPMGPWPRVAKWVLLSATYVMNTWASWAAGSPSGIVLHSVPVLAVFVAAEAVTDCQDKLTECVHRAHAYATECARQRRAERVTPTVPADSSAPLVAHPAAEGIDSGWGSAPITPALVRVELDQVLGEEVTPRSQPASSASVWSAVSGPVTAARRERPAAPRRTGRSTGRRTPVRAKSGGRVLFADYLATARQALTPDTDVTPAWVRDMTGCSRGLSSRLAAELRAQHVPVPAAVPVTPQVAEPSIDQPESNRPDGPEERAA